MYLTNAEEQVMKFLWRLEKAYIRDLIGAFPEPKPAPTTVITLLKRMIDKRIVDYKQNGSNREYFAIVTKSEYFSTHINGLIKNFFNDSSMQFASFFTAETKLNQQELLELREILDKQISIKKRRK